MTPKVKKIIVNGLALVAMGSARMPQTGIPIRNLTSLFLLYRLYRLACHPTSLEVDYTKGMAWPLMRFIDVPCALIFIKFSFTTQSVDLTSVEYCRVKYVLINILQDTWLVVISHFCLSLFWVLTCA